MVKSTLAKQTGMVKSTLAIQTGMVKATKCFSLTENSAVSNTKYRTGSKSCYY